MKLARITIGLFLVLAWLNPWRGPLPCDRAPHGVGVAMAREPDGRSKSAAPEAEQEASADERPGINRRFLEPGLDLSEWIGRFEGESREVYRSRGRIAEAVGVERGMSVADVGAGTGFFARIFADHVGPEGWVFAVEISPRFVQHNVAAARAAGLTNVSAVLCTEDSICLPPESIDVAFTCATYHHFEYPRQTLASIHRALRPGGSLVVVDFERVPGESREWVLGHVRAGKERVREEIEAAGFEWVEEKPFESLSEQYFIRFRRK